MTVYLCSRLRKRNGRNSICSRLQKRMYDPSRSRIPRGTQKITSGTRRFEQSNVTGWTRSSQRTTGPSPYTHSKLSTCGRTVLQHYVRSRKFKEGDLVLRKVFQNTAKRNVGKLGTNWEAPYKIIKVVRPGAYEIANLQDVKIPRTWNAMHINKYYH